MARKKSPSSVPAAVMPARTRRWLLGFALLGLGVSAAATYTHHQLLTQPGYLSFCDVSATVSCSQVYLSRFGAIRGVPVAVAGLFWFVLVTMLVVGAGRGPTSFRENVGSYLFGLATLGLAAILYLGYASFFLLKTVCILCLLTYVSVIGIFIVSGAVASQPMRALPRRLATDLRSLVTSPSALALAVVFIGAAAFAAARFPREVSASAPPPSSSAAAPQTAPSQDQRSEFDRWYAQQPRVNLPVDPEGAKVLVVKFNDYQCPPCRQTYEAYKSIFAKYASTNAGEVKFVTKDYPLDPECNANAPGGQHLAACEAAVAVRLARERGRGEAMEDWLFANQPSLSPDSVRAAARDVGHVTDFDARYATMLQAVKTDIALGALNNVRSTPTFFINGTMIPGGLPPQFFDQAIAYELQKAAK